MAVVIDLALFEQSLYFIVQGGKMTLFSLPRVAIYLFVQHFHISDPFFSFTTYVFRSPGSLIFINNE